jgi:AcrR family transcriptional regulator
MGAVDTGEDRGKRPPGRPVDASLGPAIVSAMLDVLAETGYARLTTAAVARRAGVSTATLYRRWPSKRELVLAAAQQFAAAESVDVDTGSAEQDLRVFLARKQRVFAGKIGATVLSLAGESVHDPELAAIFRASIFESTARHLGAVLARGAARGQGPAAVDIDAAAHLVVGTIMARLAFGAASVSGAAPAGSDELLSKAEIDLLVRALLAPGDAGT